MTIDQRRPMPLPLPDRPSIAVLPFANMSGDPEQDYFADGMAEEIITALSRCSWLFVIAQRPPRGRASSLYRTAHRRDIGGTYLGRSVRRQFGQCVRPSGPLHRKRCRGNRTAAAAGGNRAAEAQ